MKKLINISIGIMTLGYVAVVVHMPFLHGNYFSVGGMAKYQVRQVLNWITWLTPLVSLALSTFVFLSLKNGQQSTGINLRKSFILLLLYIPFIVLMLVVSTVFFDLPLT